MVLCGSNGLYIWMSMPIYHLDLLKGQQSGLVGGLKHLENISQWEGLSHILWNIIQMFETTNKWVRVKNRVWIAPR